MSTDELQSMASNFRLSGIVVTFIGFIVTCVSHVVAERLLVSQRTEKAEAREGLKISEAEHQTTKGKVTQLEEVTRPKPLKDRVVDFLNRLDPQIIPAVRTGQTDFGGSLTYAQLAELQSLTKEDSSGVFIVYVPTTNFIMNEPGKIGDQRFRLTPEVAK